MGVSQEQSTSAATVKDDVVQLLRNDVLKQKNISDKASIEIGGLIINISKNDIVKLHRSKRVVQYAKGLLDVFRVLGVRGTLAGLAEGYGIVEFGKYAVSEFGGYIFNKIDVLDKIDEPLKRLFGLSIDGPDVTPLPLEEIERRVMHNDLSKKLGENYWAIDRNHGLLSSNQGLLSGNQNLLLANQGLLSGNQGLLLANQGLLLANTRPPAKRVKTSYR